MRKNFFLVLLFFVLTNNFVFGAAFHLFTPLKRLQTKHFEFIYNEKSRPTAIYLSKRADAMFEELTTLLGYTNHSRIVVAISSDTAVFNGGATVLPYPHIILNDTPLDNEWTAYHTSIESLFLHELVHTISLDIKSPFMDCVVPVAKVLTPSLVTTPMWMVEGVTVSLESRDGFGRANDPLLYQALRNDVLSGKFLNPLDVSGVSDKYPFGKLYYYYGGLFNKWLQDTYGMPKYRKLWHLMQGDGSFIFQKGWHLFDSDYRNAFRVTYGEDLNILWQKFILSLVDVQNFDENPNAMVDKNGLFTPLLKSGDTLLWYDKGEALLKLYHTRKQTLKTIDLPVGSVESLNVSPDGQFLIVNHIVTKGELTQKQTDIFDISDFKPVGSVLNGYLDVQIWDNRKVAIRPDTHRTDLVLLEDGRERLLWKGTETLVIRHPQPLDENRLILTLTVKGRKKIGLYDLRSGQLFVLESSEAGLMDWVRSVSVDRGRVVFAYNQDRSVYRFGMLDSSNTLILQTNLYSGGVMSPCLVGEDLFYESHDTSGISVRVFPHFLSNFTGRTVGVSWKALEKQETNVDKTALGEKPYNGLKFLQPFILAPFPLFAAVSNTNGVVFKTSGFGFFTMIADPSMDNSVYIQASYVIDVPFLNVSLSWTSSSFPFSVSLNVSDLLDEFFHQRNTFLGISLEFPFYLKPEYRVIKWGVAFQGGGLMSYQDGINPYFGTYQPFTGLFSSWLGYSGLMKNPMNRRWRGFTLFSYHDFFLPKMIYKTELHLKFALPLDFRFKSSVFWANSPVLTLAENAGLFPVYHGTIQSYYRFLNQSQTDLMGEMNLEYYWRIFDSGVGFDWFYMNGLDLAFGVRETFVKDLFYPSFYGQAILRFRFPAGMFATTPFNIYSEFELTFDQKSYFQTGVRQSF